MSYTRKSAPSQKPWFEGKHKFEHWYRDNQIYFITARCKDKFCAFTEEETKQIFWEECDHYMREFEFVPWIMTLMDNHYHWLGYNRHGDNLGEMMRKIHGSVAKLVNDTLKVRLVPFWIEKDRQSYFDGCIRNEIQCRRAYRYVLQQSVRHKICRDWREYPHTRVPIDLEVGVKRALELKAFLTGVPYRRYLKH